MRSALVLMLLVLFASSGIAAATPFFDFWGYSYLEGPQWQVGTLTFVPARFDPVQPDPVIPLDLENYEYTVFVQDLMAVDIQTTLPLIQVEFDGGEIQIFEDSAKNSEWTPNPPNGTVPGRFIDGTLILSGHFTDCRMIYMTTTMSGTVQGHVDWTGGSRLGELPVTVNWLFFGGVTDNPLQEDIPEGYSMAWDPQLLPPEPTATEASTWGKIRGLFR